ncbi:MAG: HAD-IIIA family hydrolase [Bacteroidales bacterium]|nr:HAD-IIIA family hydrolase [Bacteroidales bacterium]
MKLKDLQIDKNWSLFLDRDGVINKRLMGDYVKSVDEFEFLPGVLEAISFFSQQFKYVFIVTNQQGVGKGLMSQSDLETVHKLMREQIQSHGGRIDCIFFCTDLKDQTGNCRKPGTAMGEKAFELFPDIDKNKTIMCGDTKSDMEFGEKSGMHTVFINDYQENESDNYEFQFKSLIDFANELKH